MISICKPCTIYIKFLEEIPRVFEFGSPDGELIYFRHIYGKVPRMKFNVPDIGNYIANVPFEVVKMTSIEIPLLGLPVLPAADRRRWKNPDVVRNDELQDTIARNYTEIGLIEFGPRYYQLMKPMQIFIYLHELGHFFYSDEFNCDLYALVNFVRMGYNLSTAYYTLQHSLNKTQLQIDRMKELFDKMNSIQKITV